MSLGSIIIPGLVTADAVIAALNLSTADQARVPSTIAAASRFVRKYVGRFLSRRPSADGTLGPIDVVLEAPLRGQIILPEYPINEILRCSTGKTTVFSVANTDPIHNQRATCRLVRTGGEVQGYQTTGLYLERWTSGVMAGASIDFSSLPTPTIGALARAVSALGNGWSGSAAGPETDGNDYDLWPVGELRAGQGAMGALQDPAEFSAWVEDVEIERDDEAGILTLIGGDASPFSSLRWGPTSGLEFGDDQVQGNINGVRIVYDAGYDPVPEDLADAVIEVVKSMLERKATSSTVLSERTLDWTIVNREFFHALPLSARETLAMYRDHAR